MRVKGLSITEDLYRCDDIEYPIAQEDDIVCRTAVPRHKTAFRNNLVMSEREGVVGTARSAQAINDDEVERWIESLDEVDPIDEGAA